jgi:spermidine synthase
MGTTFRALHSWGIHVTAVELVPSVPRMFSYYHDDADAVLHSPLSRVIIDDGRRYLERGNEQYDLITVDPPPPLEAAASSLLYSQEFYQLARQRLRSGGILQQWLPLMKGTDQFVVIAATRSLRDSFPYVRAFFDQFGIHYLCSDQPIPSRTPEELVLRMPSAALADFTEWAQRQAAGAQAEAYLQFSDLLQNELPLDKFTTRFADAPALTDDRPINEYYLYRRWTSAQSEPAGQGAE